MASLEASSVLRRAATSPAFVSSIVLRTPVVIPCGLTYSSFTPRLSSVARRARLLPRDPDARGGCQRGAIRMGGLFGLGLPELVVIAGIAVLVFGPKKLAGMGKELGGLAGTVKKASAEFTEAMQESLKEADEEIDRRKKEKVLGDEKAEGSEEKQGVEVAQAVAPQKEMEKTGS